MELGNRLKKARLSKGYSQSEVANLLNISRQSISRWETNKSYPDIDNLIELSYIYEISIDELLIKEYINEKSEDSIDVKEEEKQPEYLLNNLFVEESWFLLILAVFSIAISPFGLISIPLIIWRNKKGNQFYKLITLISIFVFIYNIHVLIVWMSTIFEIGVQTGYN